MSDKIFSYKRLTNLTECELVVRHSNRYQVTDQGRAWFKGPMESAVDDPRKNIIDGVNHYNHQQKQGLRDQLAATDPYQFEALIGELPRAMGYEDVEVPRASGDKGVDVVGNVQVGITAITEVMHVKRQQSSVILPIVDQLRGALPYHEPGSFTSSMFGRLSISHLSI